MVTTVSRAEEDDEKGELNGVSSAESVRIFHPDDVIQRPPSTASGSANPLKSSIKSSSSIVGSQPSAPKGEEKSQRESVRGISTAPKTNASSHGLGPEPRRGHHQRFPSTGLSLPSAIHISNSEHRSSHFEKGNSSHFDGPRASSATPLGHPTSSSNAKNPLQTRGHRRQPSLGREQKQVNFCPYDGYCFVLDETRCAICMEERGSLPAPAHVGGPWKKVLYEKQGFEDNYTDRDTFLAELKKNVNVQEYSYALVMADSLVVTQQLSVVTLFVAVFMHTLNGTLDGNAIGLLDILTATIGYFIWALCQSTGTGLVSGKNPLLSISSVFKLIGYGIGLYVISPVLAALTDPISDDTIASMSIILLLVHLSFQDYGYLNPEPVRAIPEIKTSKLLNSADARKSASPSQKETNGNHATSARSRTGSAGEVVPFSNVPASPLYHAPVSLNAAIFASLLMASRLQTHSHAFVVIAFAVEVFALFPIMAHHLKARSWTVALMLDLVLQVSAVMLLWPLSRTVTYVYICTILFTTFVSPFCLQWIQRYKNEIHGPWDEAVPARARRHGTRA
jgi:phosphatidylinositol glycan class C protein